MPGADLLALRERPRIVFNRHFVDAMAEPHGLGGDFRAEIKASAREVHLPQQVGGEKLVARRFVGEVDEEKVVRRE